MSRALNHLRVALYAYATQIHKAHDENHRPVG
ncbi:hypothetical protein PS903_02405 [Pseudomonas fluorescens]|nr:hypothetical protein PS903_02405 [Pseudomonas fluorescens]